MKAIDRITNHQTNLVSSVLIPICAAVLTVANREDPMDGGVFSEIIAGTLIWIYMFFVTSGFIQHIDALFIIPVSQKSYKYLPLVREGQDAGSTAMNLVFLFSLILSTKFPI